MNVAEKAKPESNVEHQPSKPKYFKEQFDDEEVRLVFRKHPIVMRKGLILAMFAILLGTVPALIKPEYSYFVLGLLGGFILAVIFTAYTVNQLSCLEEENEISPNSHLSPSSQCFAAASLCSRE